MNFVDPLGLMNLPDDPSGLPDGWERDPSHRDPNGERWVYPKSGDMLDWHKGREGKPGWRGKDHWHHNKGKDHLLPGDEIPDPVVPNCEIENPNLWGPKIPWKRIPKILPRVLPLLNPFALP